MQDPGGVPGWPPPGLFGGPAFGLEAGGYGLQGGQQGLPHNPSAGSLASLLDGRPLGDAAAAAAAQGHLTGLGLPLGVAEGGTPGSAAGGDQASSLGRFAAPDLASPPSASDPAPLGSYPGAQLSHQQLLAAAAPAQQQWRDAAAAGRPLRGRVGSVASISEEDLFSSTGGLEIGHDAGSAPADPPPPHEALAPADAPSRTLFARNLPPEVSDEELQQLFAAHGELRSLYTACRHRGFVLVSYYDLRAAVRAAQLLQGTPLGGRALEISFAAPKPGAGVPRVSGGAAAEGGGGGSTPQSAAAAVGGQLNQGVIVVYNLDPDTTNEQLAWIFNRFGEVKEIREAAARGNQKFIEFYDVRHAAAALRAMNRAELSGRGPLPGGGGGSGGTPTAAAAPEQQQGGGGGGAAAAQALAIAGAARSAAARGMVRPASQA
ncbi:RNA-binding protein, putative, partial [Monoraphidium neglectum]